ncbi:unnamed protein product [Mucor hiemalis]
MNTKKIFPTTAINIVCNQSNVLLEGVNVDPIPSGPFAINFTNKFNSFRNTAIKSLQSKPTLNSPVEALALNGIAMFGENTWNDYKFNHSEWEEMLIAFKNEYLESVDDVAITQSHLANTFVTDFSEQCKADVGEIDGVVERLKNKSDINNKMASRTLKLLSELSQKVSTQWKPDEMTEDSLTMNVIDPIVFGYIGKLKGTRTHGSDYELPESKERKRKIYAQAVGRKPDRSIESKIADSSYHTLLVEIKTENKCKKRPDLVKIASMMKDCLDAALKKGFDRKNLCILGILQEGRKTTILSLSTPSDFFYVLFPLSSFFLPRHTDNMEVLIKVVLGLEQCHSLLSKSINILQQPITHDNNHTYAYRISCKSPKHHAECYS